MTDLNHAFADHIARIRKIQETRIWRDGEMAETYRSARRARLDVNALKTKAREIFAEIKANGDAALQNSAAAERAKAELVPSPELVASWSAEDEALLGPLTPLDADDLNGR
jgi:hypothetical protein